MIYTYSFFVPQIIIDFVTVKVSFFYVFQFGYCISPQLEYNCQRTVSVFVPYFVCSNWQEYLVQIDAQKKKKMMNE